MNEPAYAELVKEFGHARVIEALREHVAAERQGKGVDGPERAERVGASLRAAAGSAGRAPVAGITAKDDQTVVFQLTHPASYFVDMLTLPSFSPSPKEYDA